MSKIKNSSARYSHYELLKVMGKTLTSSLDKDDVLKMVMEFIGDIFTPANWSLLLVDEHKPELYFSIVVGETAEKIKDLRIPIGKGIAGWSVQHAESVIIEDTSEDDRFLCEVDEESGFQTKSVIAVPLICKENILGVIELINVDKHCFEQDHIELLSSLADFAAIAIENARYVKNIEERSIRDDCTNLFNARHMHDLIDTEINRAERNQSNFSMVFIDLDRFKLVNDNYGHVIGSQLLSNVAEIIRTNLRPTDWPIRYGGDEFVIILPEAGHEFAGIITERIKKKLNETLFFQEQGFNINVAASFGIATFPEDAKDHKSIIEAADKAMYEAKNSGRNRIVHFRKEKV
jgi:diguanylate cyclase (GGDEF)-like protein